LSKFTAGCDLQSHFFSVFQLDDCVIRFLPLLLLAAINRFSAWVFFSRCLHHEEMTLCLSLREADMALKRPRQRLH
jgi:hypothetical protein